jgi:hypothetical protein
MSDGDDICFRVTASADRVAAGVAEAGCVAMWSH